MCDATANKMQIQEFEDAKLIQKMFYAGQCFTHAKAAAEYVLKNNITEDAPAFYPLMTSLFVLYGKPFKNSRGIGSLGEEIIPVQHQELHRDLLKHRINFMRTPMPTPLNGVKWDELTKCVSWCVVRRIKVCFAASSKGDCR